MTAGKNYELVTLGSGTLDKSLKAKPKYDLYTFCPLGYALPVTASYCKNGVFPNSKAMIVVPTQKRLSFIKGWREQPVTIAAIVLL